MFAPTGGTGPDPVERSTSATLAKLVVVGPDPRRLRVLLVGPRPEHPGGITRAVDSWIDAGLGEVADVKVVGMAAWDASRPVQAVQFATGLLAVARHLVSRRHRPDLVHLQVSSGASLYRKCAAACIAWCAGVPFIVHLHSGGFQSWIDGNIVHRLAARRLIGSASGTIVVAAHWKSLAEELGAQDVYVVSHMLPPGLAEKFSEAPRDTRPRSDAGGPLAILYYGRWSPVKGLDLLANAIAQLSAAHRQRLKVRIFGNGDRAWAEQLFRDLTVAEVSIHGWLSDADKAQELETADVVVAPSRQEAFGASLLEVMAAGTPLITSDAGAIPEVVQGYPLAMVISSGSVVELRDAIRSFMEGRWPETVDRPSRSHLHDRYSPKAVIDGLMHAYRRSVRGRAKKHDLHSQDELTTLFS